MVVIISTELSCDHQTADASQPTFQQIRELELKIVQSLSQERFLDCLKSDIWTVTDDGNHIHNAGAIKFDWFANILLLSEEILAPICNFLVILQI